MSYHIEYYETEKGKQPFFESLKAIIDPSVKTKILIAIRKLRLGNTCNTKYLRNGIFEIKVNKGPGYRIYYAHTPGNTLIIFLVGTKKRQQADIDKSISFWQDYRIRMYS